MCECFVRCVAELRIPSLSEAMVGCGPSPSPSHTLCFVLFVPRALITAFSEDKQLVNLLYDHVSWHLIKDWSSHNLTFPLGADWDGFE